MISSCRYRIHLSKKYPKLTCSCVFYADGKLVFKQQVESQFHSRAVIHAPDATKDDQDAEQEHPTREICVSFDKTDFGKCTTSFFRRDVPAYKNQEPTPGKHSKKGNEENENHEKEGKWDTQELIQDEHGSAVQMYKVAEIGARQGFGDASAQYRVITGPPIQLDKTDVNKGEETNTLLVAERLTTMKFRAVVKSFEEGQDPNAGEVVAKCVQTNKLATKFEVDVAPGQDIIAIFSIILSVAGDGGNVGALAGAGVI